LVLPVWLAASELLSSVPLLEQLSQLPSPEPPSLELVLLSLRARLSSRLLSLALFFLRRQFSLPPSASVVVLLRLASLLLQSKLLPLLRLRRPWLRVHASAVAVVAVAVAPAA
jgi:hypothetical protein